MPVAGRPTAHGSGRGDVRRRRSHEEPGWLLPPGLLLFLLGGPLLFQRLGRLLLAFLLSIHALAHDSLLMSFTDAHHILALRRLNVLRPACRRSEGGPPVFRPLGCRPVASRGGLGGFSLTRLMRSSRPTTRTFCRSLNICFGMPSGRSTKLWSSRISTRPMCTPSMPDSLAMAPTM